MLKKILYIALSFYLFSMQAFAENKIIKVLKKGKTLIINKGKDSTLKKGSNLCVQKNGKEIAFLNFFLSLFLK